MIGTTWVPMGVQGVFVCPCGRHPVLGLRRIDGEGWLAVELSPEQARSLRRGADPTFVSPLKAAVDIAELSTVTVHLTRGHAGLGGLVEIDCDGAPARIHVDASDAVALAMSHRIAVEVPADLVQNGCPAPWRQPWTGADFTSAYSSGPVEPVGSPAASSCCPTSLRE